MAKVSTSAQTAINTLMGHLVGFEEALTALLPKDGTSRNCRASAGDPRLVQELLPSGPQCTTACNLKTTNWVRSAKMHFRPVKLELGGYR
jgi:hypothetical protein